MRGYGLEAPDYDPGDPNEDATVDAEERIAALEAELAAEREARATVQATLKIAQEVLEEYLTRWTAAQRRLEVAEADTEAFVKLANERADMLEETSKLLAAERTLTTGLRGEIAEQAAMLDAQAMQLGIVGNERDALRAEVGALRDVARDLEHELRIAVSYVHRFPQTIGTGIWLEAARKAIAALDKANRENEEE